MRPVTGSLAGRRLNAQIMLTRLSSYERDLLSIQKDVVVTVNFTKEDFAKVIPGHTRLPPPKNKFARRAGSSITCSIMPYGCLRKRSGMNSLGFSK